MIKLHRLNGQEILINADLIEMVFADTDTIICLFGGNRLIVQESPEEVQNRVIEYKRKVYSSGPEISK